jgi:hypothetical protein
MKLAEISGKDPWAAVIFKIRRLQQRLLFL